LCRSASALLFLHQSVFSHFHFLALFGCAKAPTKEDHIKQVKAAIVKAGGEEKILEEARILLKRLPKDHLSGPNDVYDNHFKGLTAITNLGDVFTSRDNRIEIRVYNNHFDVFHIVVLNPDDPQFRDFEPIAGKIGFINLPSVNDSSQNRP
jgi:hypothetical protein